MKHTCTKFRGNWPAGSGEEDSTIYGHGGHLGYVTSIMSSDLSSESFHTKFGSDRHSSF